jgi:hypothetical protein
VVAAVSGAWIKIILLFFASKPFGQVATSPKADVAAAAFRPA